MSAFPDPVAQGLARGWKVTDTTGSAALTQDIECDVVIVGTGAGGGISAEILARSGLSVVLVEEGPLRSARDFDMRESTAYSSLYQESGARKTQDKAVSILQGRNVGGSTTVNWTSSFRTPASTLAFWQARHQLTDYTTQELDPWFARVEKRLSIRDWSTAPNENNAILRRGAKALGFEAPSIRRNVTHCMNLGYCGMGCPVSAKQSMLVTTIPAALDRGARLLTRARAHRLILDDKRATGLEVQWLDADGMRPSGQTCTIRARHYVLSGGAINTPALLLRSKVPDPNELIGSRTYLHPVVVSSADFEQAVDGFQGAVQTVYTDHYLDTRPIDGPLGFKIETPPIHPLLFASTTPGMGEAHARRMQRLRNTQAMIALMRDGFSPVSPQGRVRLRDDGSPVLDYQLNDAIFEAARRALLAMAELQFAAGARTVLPAHEHAVETTSLSAAREAIKALRLEPLLLKVSSAHVMGGCAMSPDAARGVTRPDGHMHALANVSVHDGSLFPTSIGANPQLSIYAITARLSSMLATKLSGKTSAGLG